MVQIAEKIQPVKVAAPPVQAVTVTTAATLTKQKKKVSTWGSQLLNDYQTQSEADSIQDDKKIKAVDKAGKVQLNPTQLVQQEGSKKGKAAKGRKKGKPARPRYQRTKEALWDGSWLGLFSTRAYDSVNLAALVLMILICCLWLMVMVSVFAA